MKINLGCIMLVDDNPDDNFFHERVIRNNQFSECVIPMESAMEALDYLKGNMEKQSPHIDIILLDINMPGMNGWEFLEEYDKLDKKLKAGVIVVMLTTSESQEDKEKLLKLGFTTEFKTKPLTKEMMEEILEKYFVEK
ncbi:MAG TPA: response regulator [Bacteroidia bacterium]|nr:response regulator [Bacteroidia bacterium]